MLEDRYSPEQPKEHRKAPEARYAYYRRCPVFRRGGEQCKAPAEKESHICYAHGAQRAMAFRRDLERQIVLAEAAAQMRRRGKPECEIADLFMDFNCIQITLAVVAKAVIDGRIDGKTAGRLLMQLQMAAKLLRMIYRKGREGRKENRVSPQICAEQRRLDKGEENQNLTAEARRRGEKQHPERNWVANEREETRIVLVNEVVAIAERRGWAHAPPELLRAA